MSFFGGPNVQKLVLEKDIRGLIKALKSDKKRREAIEALVQIGTIRGYEYDMKQLMESQDDPLIWDAVVEVAFRIQSSPAAYVQLGFANRFLQLSALRVLSKADKSWACRPLRDFVNTSETRLQAIEILAHLGPDAAESLSCGLRYDDSRAKVVDILARIDPMPIDILKQALDYPDVRSQVVDLLIRDGRSSAVDILIGALVKQQIHMNIILQLGQAAIPQLLWNLRFGSDTDSNILDALDQLQWKPSLDESSLWYWIGRRNWAKCVECGPTAIVPLVTEYKNASDKHPQDVPAIANAISQFGDAAIKLLLKELQQSGRKSTYRANLLKVLEQIGDTAVKALVASFSEVFKSYSPSVGFHVAYALREMTLGPADNQINEWIRHGEWGRCIEAGQPAIIPLKNILSSDNRDTLRCAAGALGQISTRVDKDAFQPEIVVALISLLEHEAWEIRQAATWALGEIRHPIAIDPLFGISLNDQNENVCKDGLEALLKIGDPPGGFFIHMFTTHYGSYDSGVSAYFHSLIPEKYRVPIIRALAPSGTPEVIEKMLELASFAFAHWEIFSAPQPGGTEQMELLKTIGYELMHLDQANRLNDNYRAQLVSIRPAFASNLNIY